MSSPYELHFNDGNELNNMGRHYFFDGSGGGAYDNAMSLLEYAEGCFKHPNTDITITIHAPCQLERDHWWTGNDGVTTCYLCKRSYQEVHSKNDEE